MKVHVLFFIDGWSETLPHVLESYRASGQSSFHIHLMGSATDQNSAEDLRTKINDCGVDVATVLAEDNLLDSLRFVLCGTSEAFVNDWFIIGAHDEIQRYPMSLESLLAECDQQGYQQVSGCFVDRIGSDGGFPAVEPDRDLDVQFPLGCFLTHPALNEHPLKPAILKGAALRALIDPDFSTTIPSCPLNSQLAQIHRFSWTRQHLTTIRSAGETDPDDTAAAYFRRTNWRVDTDNPLLHVAECTPEYKAWESIKELVRQFEIDGVFPQVRLDGNLTEYTLPVPIRINIGAETVAQFRGDCFGSTHWSPNPCETSAAPDAAPEQLYHSHRYGEFTYAFGGLKPLANYLLRLHFSEVFWALPGCRHFNVTVNGQIALREIDIVAAAGGANRAAIHSALVRSDSWGHIAVDFSNGTTDSAMVSGIEILPHDDLIRLHSLQSTPTHPELEMGSNWVRWNLAPPIRINVGGHDIGDFRGFTSPQVSQTDHPIDCVVSSVPASLYASHGWGACSYTFASLAPHGTYLLKLHFAEIFWTKPGERVFDIAVNGLYLAAALDVQAEAGGSFTSLVKSATVRADDYGVINISLIRGPVDHPLVCGIEILTAD